MPAQDKTILELHFVGEQRPKLQFGTFEHPMRRKDAADDDSKLNWCAGLAAFCALSIQTRLTRIGQEGLIPLRGGKKSFARALYRLIDDASKVRWPSQICGENHQGELLFCEMLERSSEDTETFFVNFEESYIEPADIKIHWGDRELAEAADLILLLTRIGAQFSEPIPVEPTADNGAAVVSLPAPRVLKNELRVGILRSADLAYTNDIRNGFFEQLSQRLKPNGITLEAVDRSGPTRILPADEAKRVWEDKAEIFGIVHERVPFDYLIGIGTQASLAMRDKLGELLGKKVPFVFLGVTHPVESGLCESMANREDASQICGVGYGDGYRDIVSRVKNLFPNRTIKYVYQRDVPQDLAVAQSLRTIPAFQDVETIETDDVPALKDLSDKRAIYISWYTFERMFESAEHAKTLLQRTVIATTRGNCRDGLAVAAVSADDREIGTIGANLVADHLLDGVDLGARRIEIPPIYTWLNLDQAEQRGIRLSKAALASARETFGDQNPSRPKKESAPILLGDLCVEPK